MEGTLSFIKSELLDRAGQERAALEERLQIVRPSNQRSAYRALIQIGRVGLIRAGADLMWIRTLADRSPDLDMQSVLASAPCISLGRLQQKQPVASHNGRLRTASELCELASNGPALCLVRSRSDRFELTIKSGL